jgi:hypothetical protein
VDVVLLTNNAAMVTLSDGELMVTMMMVDRLAR